MYLRCPKCQSDRIHARNIAKKTCAILGTIAGAIAAAIASTQRSWTGPIQRLIPHDDFGRTANRTANTLLSALIGASTGGATGAKLGAFIDEHILDSYQCLACRHKFTAAQASYQEDDEPYDQRYFHAPGRQPIPGNGFDQPREQPGRSWPLPNEDDDCE